MKTIVATFLSSILFYTDNYAQKHSSSSYPKSRSFYTKQLMDSDAVLLLSLKNLFMITAEIANRLVTMCRDGKIEEAKEELFAPDIMSIEGLLPKETTGMQAIRNKAQLFISHAEHFFGQKISEPIIAGDFFAVSWDTDLQMKDEARKTNSEFCLYHVQNGKIISEQFFLVIKNGNTTITANKKIRLGESMANMVGRKL